MRTHIPGHQYSGTQRFRCQYVNFCTSKASTFVLVQQVYLATNSQSYSKSKASTFVLVQQVYLATNSQSYSKGDGRQCGDALENKERCIVRECDECAELTGGHSCAAHEMSLFVLLY